LFENWTGFCQLQCGDVQRVKHAQAFDQEQTPATDALINYNPSPQQRLNFFPEWQGHGSFLPTFGNRDLIESFRVFRACRFKRESISDFNTSSKKKLGCHPPTILSIIKLSIAPATIPTGGFTIPIALGIKNRNHLVRID
jgi:hypothetical protein